MTKRLAKNKSEMELLELRTRLDHQDKTLAHQDKVLELLRGDINLLSQLLKGSSSLNMEGVIPMLNKQSETMQSMDKKIDTRFIPIEAWKQKVLDREGMWIINKNNIFVRAGMIITGLGGVIAIVLGIFKVIDWLHGK